MPYENENDPKLPERIRGLSAGVRRRWIAVWNNTFDRCQAQGGDTSDCEGEAFRNANGVIAKGKYDGIDFKPPAGVKAAAKRGLKLHEEGKTGSGIEPITITWARRVANGEAISPEKARQGNRFWGRNKRFLDFPKDSPAYASAMLWFGRPGVSWFASLVSQMDRADKEVSKMISIDGINIPLEELLTAMKQPAGGQREVLREAQRKRAEKFRIKVLQGSPLTIPARFARLGAKAEDFADPVNFAYPVWLTKPDRESLTPTQLGQVRNAAARFGQFADRYDTMSRAQVERRLDEAYKKFGIGEYKETEAEKSWDYEIVKADKEKQIVYGVALRANRPDSQNDIITKEEIEKAAHRFLIESRRGDLQHKEMLSDQDFKVVESAIARVDERPHIQAGDWVLAVKLSDRLWKQVKDKKINAFSIRGVGRRRPVN